jgi:hypothetical protein
VAASPEAAGLPKRLPPAPPNRPPPAASAAVLFASPVGAAGAAAPLNENPPDAGVGLAGFWAKSDDEAAVTGGAAVGVVVPDVAVSAGLAPNKVPAAG